MRVTVVQEVLDRCTGQDRARVRTLDSSWVRNGHWTFRVRFVRILDTLIGHNTDIGCFHRFGLIDGLKALD